MAELGASSFVVDKARVLGQVDLSRKGSVDAAIVPLVDYVNSQDHFYTTSSCAGRLVLFAEVWLAANDRELPNIGRHSLPVGKREEKEGLSLVTCVS